MFFVSPKELRIGEDIKKHLEKNGARYSENEQLEPILGNVNVIYQTRIQRERFPTIKEYEKFKGAYIIDKKIAEKIKPTTIIMHPLPRVNEISPEVDALPSAAYFRQAYYGLLTRMALLKFLLSSTS